MTTPSENVAKIVHFDIIQVYPLEKLSNKNILLVFGNHAFPRSESNNNRSALERIGREIVKKFNGSPLAAQSLRGTLRKEYDIRDWNNILERDM
uniref:Disease resistance protein RGA1 n=1 Tax=Cajanus cajan TaxID=3821 RepID=A0A151R3V4_CAJCA|nr:Putative disease resistance protein RGA1 [Cajanus cajan]